MSENAARGIDLVQEYYNPYIIRVNAAHPNEDRLPKCESRWIADDDAPESWGCSREPGHDGLHVALVEIDAIYEGSIRTVLAAAAMWADEGVLRR